MTELTRARAAVALPLPRIPPWTAPTPEAKAKAAEAQRRREEGERGKKGLSAGGIGGEGLQGMQNGIGGIVVGMVGGKTREGIEGENRNMNGVGVGNGTVDEGVRSAIGEKLAGLEGLRVKVTNILGKSYTGSIYTSSDELVLSTGTLEYHLIPISKIRGYEILEREQFTEPPYDTEDCKAPPKHGKQLERVKELVRTERERVTGRRGG